MNDEWKKLEDEYADIANQINRQVDILDVLNKSIFVSEAWDPGASKKMTRDGLRLQDVGILLQKLGYEMRVTSARIDLAPVVKYEENNV
jgi:hypothetical protein|tara:strand:+ start:1721 stop:1987 length:267 start_codon:yes stop_codon:yes gene_type:complete